MEWQEEMVELFRTNVERKLRSVIKTKLFVNYLKEYDTIQVVIKDDEKLVWKYPNVIDGLFKGELQRKEIVATVITEYKKILVERAFNKAFWNN